MEANFWHQKWERGEIAFHQSQANPLLVAHLDQLNLKQGDRVFLPLCGKTLDIAWLRAKGYRIAGAELSELAILALFESLALVPEITQIGELKRFSEEGIDIFVGNIFALTPEMLGDVDAIYDRAALVALPLEMRKQYTAHLIKLTHTARQFVIAYEYDQALVDGPPFSISAAEIQQHYAPSYTINALQTQAVEGGMKGKVEASETVWLLQKRR